MYHVTVAQMRLIEWARSFNWAVRFPDWRTPKDFAEWFPASDVNYTLLMIEKQDFFAGVGAFDIPKGTAVNTLTLTCYDGSRTKDRGPNANVLQLHDWIRAWGRDIVDLRQGVLTLSEACRPIEVIHYNSLSNRIGGVTYAVFPHGEVSFTGGSEADINRLELTFSIAGVVETGTPSSVR